MSARSSACTKVPIGAVAEYEDIRTVGNPVEQNAEDAEAAVTENRAWTNDAHVEAVGGSVEAGPLCGKFGEAICASCGAALVVGSTGLGSGTPNTALDDVCTTLATRVLAHAFSRMRVPSTFTVRQVFIFGEGYLGDVVKHHVHAIDADALSLCCVRRPACSRCRSRWRPGDSDRGCAPRSRWRAVALQAAHRSNHFRLEGLEL